MDRRTYRQRTLEGVGFLVLVLCSWREPAHARPVPIGVGVHITRKISDPWTPSEAEDVKGAVASELHRRLTRFAHWDFALEDPALHRAVLRLAVREGGPNQVLVGIELLLRPKGGAEGATTGPPISLVQRVWFEPGDGLPSPTRAKSELLAILNEFLPETESPGTARGLNETELRARVPIAEGPRWHDAAKRCLVLPLPRARYGHLYQAVFFVQSRRDQSTLRWTAEARGFWSRYDDGLPEALDVFVLDPLQDADVEKAELTAVFLKEYQPPGWET